MMYAKKTEKILDAASVADIINLINKGLQSARQEETKNLKIRVDMAISVRDNFDNFG